MYMALKPFFIQKTVSFNAPGCGVQREGKENGVQRLFIYQEKTPLKMRGIFFLKNGYFHCILNRTTNSCYIKADFEAQHILFL